MKKLSLLVLLCLISVAVLLLAMGIGSVSIAVTDTVRVLTGATSSVDETVRTILLNIRIPRALLAFISGAGLAVSGVMMQSVLRNPLASSFTLGVSSGAALGASLAILFSMTLFGIFTLPIFGLVFGLITVFLALAVATRVDRNLQNNSIILTGMAFSLFANAMITIVMALSAEKLQRIVYWQMGSFAMRSSDYIIILFVVVVVCFVVAMRYARQMDIMTFGDEEAMVSGVRAKRVKWTLLSLSTVLTGAIVSVVGIIGFVDLFTPHMARKLFGASHKWVLPAAALLGGAFMVVCDLIARTIVAPLELPVGAITSLIGAPFFLYLYFSKRKSAV